MKYVLKSAATIGVQLFVWLAAAYTALNGWEHADSILEMTIGAINE